MDACEKGTVWSMGDFGVNQNRMHRGCFGTLESLCRKFSYLLATLAPSKMLQCARGTASFMGDSGIDCGCMQATSMTRQVGISEIKEKLV